MKRGAGGRVERVYCGDEEGAGCVPQTSSVSTLDHTLMRHLCGSEPSVRLSDVVSACQFLEKQQQPSGSKLCQQPIRFLFT